MSIVKRGPDSWQVRIFLGRDQEGKIRSYNETIRGSRKVAEEFQTKKKRERDLGIVIERTTVTLGEYLDRWFEVSAKGRLRKRTFEDYQEYMKRYVLPAIGNKKLGQIKPLDIQALYTLMLSKGLSPRTVRYAHAILSSSLKQAVKWQILPFNPASMVDLPKSQRKEMKAFSPAEARRFLNASEMSEWHVVFSLALTTGMRPEEYLGLKWKDIDFANGRAVVQRALVWARKGGGWSLEEPKTAQSRRSIPLPATVIKDLGTHRRTQLARRMKLGAAYSNHDFVFATEVGTPLLASNLTRRHFKPILKKAGLPMEFRLYDLRHSCATLLLSNGVSPKIVAERLGHSTIVMTLDTYSHVLPSMQQDATEELESMLFRRMK